MLKPTLESLATTFQSPETSVMCLARSEQEPGGSEDRNWNWRMPDYRYAPSRARSQPGYVGSYAMDGMAMALHCVYHTSSFRGAVLKCVNMGGDADSVGSLVGQIAGSFYGAKSIPEEWIRELQRWDRGGDIALRAFLLFSLHQTAIPTPGSVVSPAAT